MARAKKKPRPRTTHLILPRAKLSLREATVLRRMCEAHIDRLKVKPATAGWPKAEIKEVEVLFEKFTGFPLMYHYQEA